VGDDDDDRKLPAVKNIDNPSPMPIIDLDEDEMATFPQRLHRNVYPPSPSIPPIVSPFGMGAGMSFSPSAFFAPSSRSFQIHPFGLNENSQPGNFLNLPSNGGMQAPTILPTKSARKSVP
jgi:hypothetical protein